MTSLRCPTLWPYVTSLYTKVMVVISPRRGSPNLSSQDENSKVFPSNHNTMTKHYSDFTTQLIGLKVYSHLTKVELKRKRSKNKRQTSKKIHRSALDPLDFQASSSSTSIYRGLVLSFYIDPPSPLSHPFPAK